MMEKKVVEIINKLGLHARAAAKFVSLASSFQSDVQLTHKDKTVNGKSIMGVMLLAAGKGSEVTLEVSGDDAADSIKSLSALVEDRFGEGE